MSSRRHLRFCQLNLSPVRSDIGVCQQSSQDSERLTKALVQTRSETNMVEMIGTKMHVVKIRGPWFGTSRFMFITYYVSRLVFRLIPVAVL